MRKRRQIETFFICPKFRGILLRIMSNREFKWENSNFKCAKPLLAGYLSLQVWKIFVPAKNTYFTWPRKNAQISVISATKEPIPILYPWVRGCISIRYPSKANFGSISKKKSSVYTTSISVCFALIVQYATWIMNINIEYLKTGSKT